MGPKVLTSIRENGDEVPSGKGRGPGAECFAPGAPGKYGETLARVRSCR